MTIAENFSETSRVWVYSADRFLNEEEEVYAQKKLSAFVQQWAAHGSDLKAEYAILHHNFIVLIADENEVSASGCSVDASVRFIKELGNELKINFMNRLQMLIEKKGEFKRIHFSDLANHSDWNMFDPTVVTLSEFKTKWHVPISESAFVN